MSQIVQRRLGAWGVAWRVLAMLGYGSACWIAFAGPVLDLELPFEPTARVLVVDPLIGLVALGLAVTLLRRHPLPTALLILLAQSASTTAMGAASYAVVAISARRRWPEIIPVALLAVITAQLSQNFYLGAYLPAEEPLGVIGATVVNILWVGLLVAIGLALGFRRQITLDLHERVRAAEEQQAMRAEAARVAERNRIAREMHDVLAHRISLVAMHAGVLSYRRDLSADEQAAAAQTIAENAHLALEELRDVLGVLRSDSATGEVDRPQPKLADLPELVQESIRAGMVVELELAVASNPPAALGRTVYRVVQEALTNARKHAPGAPIRIRVVGDAATGIRIDASNPRSAPESSFPSSGLGLLGLRERVAQLAGTLDFAETEESFTLTVWLPWTP